MMETDEKAHKKHTQTQCAWCLYKWLQEILQKPEIPTLWRNVFTFTEICVLYSVSQSVLHVCLSLYLYLPLSARVSFSFKRFCYRTLWITLFSFSRVAAAAAAVSRSTPCNGVDFCGLCSIFLLLCFVLFSFDSVFLFLFPPVFMSWLILVCKNEAQII